MVLDRRSFLASAAVSGAALAFGAAPFAAMAATPDSWITEWPLPISTTKKEQMSLADIFEVVASMKGNAEADLQKKTFLAISEVQAKWFTGRYYSCPAGKRPYLVRGVFGFAGTGRFFVYKVDRALWVLHESLGTDFVSSRTALIVNLDFEPTAAYATVSIAQ